MEKQCSVVNCWLIIFCDSRYTTSKNNKAVMFKISIISKELLQRPGFTMINVGFYIHVEIVIIPLGNGPKTNVLIIVLNVCWLIWKLQQFSGNFSENGKHIHCASGEGGECSRKTVVVSNTEMLENQKGFSEFYNAVTQHEAGIYWLVI